MGKEKDAVPNSMPLKRKMPRVVLAMAGVALLVVLTALYGVKLLNSQRQFCALADTYTSESETFAQGAVYRQTFSFDEPFSGVFLRFVTYGVAPLGEGVLTLTDVADGSVCFQTAVDFSSVQDLVPTEFRMEEPVTPQPGAQYMLELRVTDLPAGTQLSLACSPGDAYEAGTMSQNGVLASGDLAFGVTQPRAVSIGGVWWLVIFLIAGAALVLWLLLCKNIALEYGYLLSAIVLGVVFLFAQPALYGFDIPFHFDSSYVLSNRILGYDSWNGSGEYLRRACDDISDLPLYRNQNQLVMYESLGKEFLQTSSQVEAPVKQEYDEIGSPLYLYLPQALGFSLARVLGLGRFGLLFCGRALNYAVLVALAFGAIRSAPRYKALFAITALLPAVCTQGVSLSRDTLIIGLALFCIAKCLQIAFSEQALTVWKGIQLTLSIALLAPCKLIYLPLALLPFIFLCSGRRRKDRRFWIWALVQLAAACAMFAFYDLMRVADLATTRTTVNDAYFTIGWLIQNPVAGAAAFFNTVIMRFGDYLVNAVATFEIDMGLSAGVVVVFCTLLVLSVLTGEKQSSLGVKRLERAGFVLVFVAVFGAALLAAFQWTATTSLQIQGMQGRYLTPVLPLLFLTVSEMPLLSLRRSIERELCAAALICDVLVICKMFLWVLGA